MLVCWDCGFKFEEPKNELHRDEGFSWESEACPHCGGNNYSEEDRPCWDCIWHDGECLSWDCDYLSRRDLRKLAKSANLHDMIKEVDYGTR